MNLRTLMKGATGTVIAAAITSGAALAYEITVPSMDYRTGPYAQQERTT